MSRRYRVEFMDEANYETIYQQYARTPEPREIIGRWNDRMVSDSALTPRSHVFTFTEGEEIKMEYLFANILRGESRVNLTKEQLELYDFTNWHDEVRIVNDNFMIGKYCSPWASIPLNFGPSFLGVEEEDNKHRFVLRYILEKI